MSGSTDNDRNEKKDTALLPLLPWHQRIREFPHLRDITPGNAALLSARWPEPFIILGHDAETDALIPFADTARRAGCYIVGRSGTGKSTLLVNMIDQDLKNGHGVFFLDPQSDAIANLLSGAPRTRLERDLVLLDPEDPTHSFGINLFACRDIADRGARTETYRRVYEVFQKLWEQEWKERPWLQLIVQYVIYVFLENPDYTLADVPRFLRDPKFREQLVGNVKYNWEAQDFWRYSFHEKQREAMETRVFMLLGDPFVKHIICQGQTTINFAEIMEKKQVVFVRLSPRLPPDVKTFIGTILISELLQAVQHRGTLPPDQRHQFCIFVDEFQTFASYQDFAVLFTQARKFGIATTVAHQERYGQFADNKAILGATDAAGNKVFFQLTVRDAEEQAPEFAKPAPMESKLEPGISITNNPFDLLVIGHTNEDIRRFARTYLLRIKERKDDLEAERALTDIMQTDLLQSAEISRLAAQIEGLYANEHAWSEKEKALHDAKDALLRAKQLTAHKMDLWKHARVTTHTIRYLNRVFVAIMEGDLRPWPGDERFSEFLIDCARHSSWVPWRYVELLSLYLSLVYGDPNGARAIPFSFAKAHGIFTNDVALLTHQAAEKTAQTREKFREQYLQFKWKLFPEQREYEAKKHQKKQEEELAEVTKQFMYYPCSGVLGAKVENHHSRLVQNTYTNFVWLLAYPDVLSFVSPYLTCQFAATWKPLARPTSSYKYQKFTYGDTVDGRIDEITESILHSYASPISTCWGFLSLKTVNELVWFMQKYKEGAFVTLELLNVAWHGNWAFFRDRLPSRHPTGGFTYKNFCTTDFPGIAGVDPLELLRFIKKLNELMQSKLADTEAFLDTVLRYFQICPSYFEKPQGTNKLLSFFIEKQQYKFLNKEQYLASLWEYGKFCLATVIGDFPLNFGIHYDNCGREREDMQLLKQTLNERWEVFSREHPGAASRWIWCDDLARSYLIARAADLVRFGERIANVTFPLPSFPGAEALVTSLVQLLRDIHARLAQAEEQKAAEEYRQRIEKEAAEQMAKISFDPPDHLPPRVLSDEDRDRLKAVLLNELAEGKQRRWDVQNTLAVIDEFARFCWLLSLPENHIYAPSGQYTKRLVPSRTVKDMTDEMAQELGSLPLHTAYVKVLQEQDGRQTVLKRKIHPLPPLPTRKEDHSAVEHEAIQRTHAKHSRERDLIEEELRYRQEAWRKAEAERTKQRAQKQEHPFRPKAPGAEEPPPGQS